VQASQRLLNSVIYFVKISDACNSINTCFNPYYIDFIFEGHCATSDTEVSLSLVFVFIETYTSKFAAVVSILLSMEFCNNSLSKISYHFH
jgi:hypothetical protein